MPIALFVSGQSDVGKLRRRNEDSVALRPELGVAVVADGMGGHPGGDVASRIAADTAAETLAAGRTAIEQDASSSLELMERAVRAAHEAIRTRGEEEPELAGMGTTLTAMLMSSETGAYVVGHVGDSRCYLFRKGDLTQLTRDDTWVQQQIDDGVFTEEEARRNPYSHLLTQCLGLDDPPDVQVLGGKADSGDAYLLCTDGLVGMLEDAEMVRILQQQLASASDGDGDGPLSALLDAANEAGGHDNITAALVRVGSS